MEWIQDETNADLSKILMVLKCIQYANFIENSW